MGWSHTLAAGRTLEKIESACEASRPPGATSTNVFVCGPHTYFYEVEPRDQPDGGIKGTIHRMFTKGDQEVAQQTDEFEIDGRGRLKRGPQAFYDALLS